MDFELIDVELLYWKVQPAAVFGSTANIQSGLCTPYESRKQKQDVYYVSYYNILL